MMRHSLSDDLALAEKAARLAGASLRDAFGADLDVTYKSATQPVTVADHEANRICREELLRNRPGYGWISEESDGSGGEPVWIVDPLDGTWNFIEGRPEFAVCIALQSGGTAVLGVVYNPVTDAMYSAARGQGATMNGATLGCRAVQDEAVVLVSAKDLDEPWLNGLEGLGEVRTLGSTSLKMVAVAEGGADAYLSRRRKGIWDVAAASVIVVEAGGSAVDLAGSPLVAAGDPVYGVLVTGARGESRRRQWIKRLGDDRPNQDEEER